MHWTQRLDFLLQTGLNTPVQWSREEVHSTQDPSRQIGAEGEGQSELDEQAEASTAREEAKIFYNQCLVPCWCFSHRARRTSLRQPNNVGRIGFFPFRNTQLYRQQISSHCPWTEARAAANAKKRRATRLTAMLDSVSVPMGLATLSLWHGGLFIPVVLRCRIRHTILMFLRLTYSKKIKVGKASKNEKTPIVQVR